MKVIWVNSVQMGRKIRDVQTSFTNLEETLCDHKGQDLLQLHSLNLRLKFLANIAGNILKSFFFFRQNDSNQHRLDPANKYYLCSPI